jgi:hypothetical protein
MPERLLSVRKTTFEFSASGSSAGRNLDGVFGDEIARLDFGRNLPWAERPSTLHTILNAKRRLVPQL